MTSMAMIAGMIPMALDLAREANNRATCRGDRGLSLQPHHAPDSALVLSSYNSARRGFAIARPMIPQASRQEENSRPETNK